MLRKLVKGAVTVGAMTMISRILGFVRDVVIARMFGASAEADAFFVAFKIPNFFRRLTAEGAFSQAFVPVFTDVRHKSSQEETHRLLDAVWTRLTLFLLALTLLGMLFAEPVMLLFAPGFAGDARMPMAVEMLQLTFPYLLLISLVAMLSAVLNSHERYWEPAFNPVWLNVSMIASAMLLSDWLAIPAMSLAYGVLVAGLIQLAWVIWALAPVGWRPRFTLDSHEGVGRVLRNMLPALFGVSVAQINLLVSTILASFLMAGSVSWLYYADRLLEFPVGILGVALATVVLPSLSKARAEENWQSYDQTLDYALRLIWLVGVPATLALVLLSEPLMLTLFAYDAFSTADAHQASLALVGYGVGLLALLAIKILAPAYYAREQMALPVKISVIALVVNLALSLLLIDALAHVGLAFAVSGAAVVNAFLLWLGLRYYRFYQPQIGWGKLLLQIGLASIGMAVALWWLNQWVGDWASLSGAWRSAYLLLMVVVGLVTYPLLLLVVGMRLRDWRRLQTSAE